MLLLFLGGVSRVSSWDCGLFQDSGAVGACADVEVQTMKSCAGDLRCGPKQGSHLLKGP